MHCSAVPIRRVFAVGRAAGALLAAAMLLAGMTGAALAVPVTSLYVVLVPGIDAAQAAQDAMRVELVRLTGRRSAASDPALATLISMARQYVQLERATTSGQTQVVFDESALSAAITGAGAALWGADRPLLWVSLPPLDAPGDQTLRQRLTQAAGERGLPLSLAPAASPTSAATSAPAAPAPAPAGAAASAVAANPQGAAPAPGAAPAGSSTPAPAGAAGSQTPASLTPAAALDAAHAAGANAALVAALVPAQPGALQWTLSTADGGGQWVGSPELAIDQAADTLATTGRAINQSPLGQFACQVSGVTDLAALVSVLDAVRAAAGVSQVSIEQVDGDQLTLQLSARGSGPELERAIAGGGGLQPAGTGTDGLLEYHYVAGR